LTRVNFDIVAQQIGTVQGDRDWANQLLLWTL
jgi:hypothetical protein